MELVVTGEVDAAARRRGGQGIERDTRRLERLEQSDDVGIARVEVAIGIRDEHAGRHEPSDRFRRRAGERGQRGRGEARWSIRDDMAWHPCSVRYRRAGRTVPAGLPRMTSRRYPAILG